MPHSTYLPERMGAAEISPTGKFEAGSFESFTLVYTAGYFGIDDTGSIKIVHRFASDMGRPQWSDPKAANYTTVEASNGAVLDVLYDPKLNIRPVGQDPDDPGHARLSARRRHDHRAVRRPPAGLARNARADFRRADVRVPRSGRRLCHLQLRRTADPADDLDRCRPAGDLEGGVAHAAARRRDASASASRARTNGATPATRSRASLRCGRTDPSLVCPKHFR